MKGRRSASARRAGGHRGTAAAARAPRGAAEQQGAARRGEAHLFSHVDQVALVKGQLVRLSASRAGAAPPGARAPHHTAAGEQRAPVAVDPGASATAHGRMDWRHRRPHAGSARCSARCSAQPGRKGAGKGAGSRTRRPKVCLSKRTCCDSYWYSPRYTVTFPAGHIHRHRSGASSGARGKDGGSVRLPPHKRLRGGAHGLVASSRSATRRATPQAGPVPTTWRCRGILRGGTLTFATAPVHHGHAPTSCTHTHTHTQARARALSLSLSRARSLA